MSTLPPVVLLCTPRSFSSVINAMLGCHPALAALPEQNLFLAPTLGELLKYEEAFGPQRGYLAGTRRAIADLEFGAQNETALHEAERWLRRRCSWQTNRMFHWLQQKVAPRALVYKSPRAALCQAAMQRTLAVNPQARFLHLLREPGAAIADWAASSDQPNQPDQPNQLGQPNLGAHRFFAEIWLQAQQRIRTVIRTLPEDRAFSIKSEDVVNRPLESVRTLIAWLGLDAAQSTLEPMLHPELWSFTGSLATLYAADNDKSFLEHPQLRTTPPPRLSVEALTLDIDLTRDLIQMGQALGYTLHGPE